MTNKRIVVSKEMSDYLRQRMHAAQRKAMLEQDPERSWGFTCHAEEVMLILKHVAV